jgi:hypothetical protein
MTPSDVTLAVESVHRDDPHNTHGPASRRSPYVLEEDYAAWDEAQLERCREKACRDCRQIEAWLVTL